MQAPPRKKMPRRNPFLLLVLAISALVLAACPPASCADPVLLPVTKDPATSLYTILLRYGASHVIDLAGPLLWSTCDHVPAEISCHDQFCKVANAYRAPTCGNNITGGHHLCSAKGRCKVYPYNPVTGQCAAAAADLVHTRLIADTTDGRNTLGQVSVRAVAACARNRALLDRLPANATGVAGMSAAGLALPAQVAASQSVAKTFLLCLPRSDRGDGVAVFGSRGPFFLKLSVTGEPSSGDLTPTLRFTPLLSRRGNPLYYIPVSGVSVGRALVPLPPHALDLSTGGGVVLCTRVPYTLLRPDVYRPVVQAFDRALARNDAKVPAVAPFGLCYRSSMLGNTRLGYAVPEITLVLKGGKNWTFFGSSSMVDVNAKTACLALLEMKGVKAGDAAAAAIVVGGFQMEDHLLQFDLEKKLLGFAKVPIASSCSNFNFTRGQ